MMLIMTHSLHPVSIPTVYCLSCITVSVEDTNIAGTTHETSACISSTKISKPQQQPRSADHSLYIKKTSFPRADQLRLILESRHVLNPTLLFPYLILLLVTCCIVGSSTQKYFVFSFSFLFFFCQCSVGLVNFAQKQVVEMQKGDTFYSLYLYCTFSFLSDEI